MFVNKYGCRTVTIIGAILSSCCLLMSCWAPNLITLYLTIGLGTGMGFGLIYLPAIVCVTVYFEKLRSLATGIAVCGSGLGTLIFAPFIGYLISEYGWRGAFMITSALMLNCIILGILFRPIEPVRRPKSIEMKDISKLPIITVNDSEENGVTANGIERPHSVSNLNQTIYKFDHNDSNESGNLIRVTTSQPTLAKKHLHQSNHSVRSFGSGVMNKPDIFLQSSLDNIQKPYDAVGTNKERVISRRESQISMPNGKDYRQNGIQGNINSNDESTGIMEEMLGLSLMKDPVFLLFVMSNFCTSIGFNIPYIYIVAQAKTRSISKDTAQYLISIIGIANTVGRITLGYISDKPWINRLLTYNLCLTICGISTVLSAFCYSLTSFVIYASVFGFTAGAYVGLTSVVLVDLLGLEHLTNAFGLVLLFQGIASFLGPPIAGWLYDALLSYDPGFYVAGGMIAISGLMLYFIPPIQKYLKKRELRRKPITMLDNVS
ncbi:hypothetical protein PV327_005604 [Microctonus hyperodae]|uniref:Major facilitator superfamily (MFS) profile domain-containing protein n=1 Tax=Microctonus hyperodae TaxID=165561 RepID=A0AA39G205_MICHY|nr:hypothetical protein PV327_005604 [Microctonus hyperodae]